MLRLDELRRLAVDLAHRVDEIGRVELVAAVVALVAARAGCAADGAGSLDVAVRQRAPRRRRNGAHGRLLDHVPVVVQPAEQLLHHRVVVAGGGAGEQVVAQPQAREVLDDLPVVPVGEFLDGDALLLRLDEQRGAVLVGAGDHQHLVARHALVAGEDVGRHAESGDVTDVAGSVGVRPGDGGEDARHDVQGKPWSGPGRAVRPPAGAGAPLSSPAAGPCGRGAVSVGRCPGWRGVPGTPRRPARPRYHLHP